MGMAQGVRVGLRGRGHLRLWDESEHEAPALLWRINGYRASLVVWSADEWARLAVRPPDARYHPGGFWCALRLD